MGGSTAGAKDAGLLLLIEMGRVHRNVLSFVAHTSSAPPESSLNLARNSPKGQGAKTASGFSNALALPKRHKQHDHGNQDADDAVEARGGLLRLHGLNA